MTYYWLSFVDDTRPEGDRFVGGCIVVASSAAGAVMEARAQDCNPGGEVAIVEITPEYEHNVARYKLNHLYSKAEIQAMGQFRTMDQAVEDGDVT